MVSLGHTIKQRTVLLAHTRRARMGQAYKKQLICENQFLGTRMDFAIGKKKDIMRLFICKLLEVKIAMPIFELLARLSVHPLVGPIQGAFHPFYIHLSSQGRGRDICNFDEGI